MSILLDSRQRDFLLLNIFVLAQHGYIERAHTLAEAMYVAGEKSPDVLSARAVLRFFKGEWAAALACLDELDLADPIERFGSYRLTEVQRLRRYIKARCLYELRDQAPGRDAIESYLRHGTAETDETGDGAA